MPKEATLFLVVEETCKRISDSSIWKASVKNVNCSRIGSIFHDSIIISLKNFNL